MKIKTKINIDLQRPMHPVVVNAVQGDQNSRCLEISLYSGGTAWQVPENITMAMRYCKPDKTKGYYDTMPDGSTAWTTAGNVVSFLLCPQMLTVAGPVFAQLELIQGTALLATYTIQVNVAANPAAGVLESEDYINWLKWMESELEQRMSDALASGDFNGPPGPTGPAGEPATVIKSEVFYQVADDGKTEPTGDWSEAIPEVPQGKYLWTRIVQQFNTGNPVTAYSVSRMGIDGLGSVVSVCGISPDGNGNVPLTAENVGALSKTGGDMTGPINMNGQNITGLNAPTKDDEAVNKEYADTLQGGAKEYADTVSTPYNYLDNADFTQFVAQAGIGGAHGTQAYAGDRWILDSGTVTGEANANGNGYSNITLNGTIRQIVANPPETGTVSVEMVSGTATAAYENGEVVITSAGGVIKNVVLYEGTYTADNMPNFQPKGYGAELAECMRYFIKTKKLYQTTAAINGVIPGAPFPIPMRVDPTVKVFDELGNPNHISTWSSSGITVVEVMQIPANSTGIVYFDTVAPANSACGYYYEANADL